MGRGIRLDPSQHAEFTACWMNPHVPLVDIIARFRITAPTVYAIRRHLGLPDRAAIREAAGLSRHGQLVVMPEFGPLAQDPKGPEATLWRCVCGGRTDNRLGHPSCQAKVA